MPLYLSPLTHPDFPPLFTHASSPLGDLAAPITPVFFPVPGDSRAVSPGRTARLHASIAHQWVQFTSDPTARFVKVVDSDSGEIVSLGRWHCYSQGWDLDEAAWREVGAGQGRVRFEELGMEGRDEAAAMAGEGNGLDARLGVEINRWWCEQRGRVFPKGGGCWALTALITRSGYRKRGAGSLILQWGCDKADADGVPAFLEAVPDAAGLYRKFGFEEVGPFHFDLKPFGGEGKLTLLNMRREPKGKRGE